MRGTRSLPSVAFPVARDAPVVALGAAAGTALTCSAAVLLSVVTWAWSDVLTWQRIFESSGMYEFDARYQAGHEVVLWGFIVLGALLLVRAGIAWSAGYAFAVYTLAYGGLADGLYYWLDGRSLPATLPWLDAGHPLLLVHPVTASSLVVSVGVWCALWSGLAILAAAWRVRRSGQARPAG